MAARRRVLVRSVLPSEQFFVQVPVDPSTTVSDLRQQIVSTLSLVSRKKVSANRRILNSQDIWLPDHLPLSAAFLADEEWAVIFSDRPLMAATPDGESTSDSEAPSQKSRRLHGIKGSGKKRARPSPPSPSSSSSSSSSSPSSSSMSSSSSSSSSSEAESSSDSSSSSEAAGKAQPSVRQKAEVHRPPASLPASTTAATATKTVTETGATTATSPAAKIKPAAPRQRKTAVAASTSQLPAANVSEVASPPPAAPATAAPRVPRPRKPSAKATSGTSTPAAAPVATLPAQANVEQLPPPPTSQQAGAATPARAPGKKRVRPVSQRLVPDANAADAAPSSTGAAVGVSGAPRTNVTVMTPENMRAIIASASWPEE